MYSAVNIEDSNRLISFNTNGSSVSLRTKLGDLMFNSYEFTFYQLMFKICDINNKGRLSKYNSHLSNLLARTNLPFNIVDTLISYVNGKCYFSDERLGNEVIGLNFNQWLILCKLIGYAQHKQLNNSMITELIEESVLEFIHTHSDQISIAKFSFGYTPSCNEKLNDDYECNVVRFKVYGENSAFRNKKHIKFSIHTSTVTSVFNTDESFNFGLSPNSYTRPSTGSSTLSDHSSFSPLFQPSTTLIESHSRNNSHGFSDNPDYSKSTVADSSHLSIQVATSQKHLTFNSEVVRRYSDFELLSVVIKRFYPGIIIPPLPPKEWSLQSLMESTASSLSNSNTTPISIPLSTTPASVNSTPNQSMSKSAMPTSALLSNPKLIQRQLELQLYLNHIVRHPILKHVYEVKVFLEASYIGFRAFRDLFTTFYQELPTIPLLFQNNLNFCQNLISDFDDNSSSDCIPTVHSNFVYQDTKTIISPKLTLPNCEMSLENFNFTFFLQRYTPYGILINLHHEKIANTDVFFGNVANSNNSNALNNFVGLSKLKASNAAKTIVTQTHAITTIFSGIVGTVKNVIQSTISQSNQDFNDVTFDNDFEILSDSDFDTDSNFNELDAEPVIIEKIDKKSVKNLNAIGLSDNSNNNASCESKPSVDSNYCSDLTNHHSRPRARSGSLINTPNSIDSYSVKKNHSSSKNQNLAGDNSDESSTQWINKTIYLLEKIARVSGKIDTYVQQSRKAVTELSSFGNYLKQLSAEYSAEVSNNSAGVLSSNSINRHRSCSNGSTGSNHSSFVGSFGSIGGTLNSLSHVLSSVTNGYTNSTVSNDIRYSPGSVITVSSSFQPGLTYNSVLTENDKNVNNLPSTVSVCSSDMIVRDLPSVTSLDTDNLIMRFSETVEIVNYHSLVNLDKLVNFVQIPFKYTSKYKNVCMEVQIYKKQILNDIELENFRESNIIQEIEQHRLNQKSTQSSKELITGSYHNEDGLNTVQGRSKHEQSNNEVINQLNTELKCIRMTAESHRSHTVVMNEVIVNEMKHLQESSKLDIKVNLMQ